MEEFYYKHPLDRLLHNDNIFLLESMIPYVDYELKFPLVIFIKIFEIKKLYHYFSDKDKINSCGLHNDNHDFSTIIHEFENMGQFSNSSPINQMLNIYKSMEMFKKMNTMMEAMGMGSMSDMMNNMMNGDGSQDGMFNFMKNMSGSGFNNDSMGNMMNTFMNNDSMGDMMNTFMNNDSMSNMMNAFMNNDMMNAFNFSNDMPVIYPNDSDIKSDIIIDSDSPTHYEPNSVLNNNINSEESLEFDFDKFFEQYDQNSKENKNE